MSKFDPFGPFRRAGTSTGSNPHTKHQRLAAAQALPWHKRPAWIRAGRQLLRWYSKRSDFSLRIKPGQKKPIACVNPGWKRVEITTAFPQPGEHADFDLTRTSERSLAPATESIRGYALLSSRPTELWLRGLIGHEAGHIRFSGEKPEPRALGWLWNALEDERMERLTAARHGCLEPIFACIGDVMLSETDEERRKRRERQQAAAEADARGEGAATQDVLSACLLWRWLHDHTEAASTGYHPYMPLPKSTFTSRLRPLVENAWEADSSDEVTEIARKILATFDIPEETEVPHDLESFDLPAGVSPTGGSLSGRDGDQGKDGTGEEDSGTGAHRPETCGAAQRDLPDTRDASGPEPEMPTLDPQSHAGKEAANFLKNQEADARALAETLRSKSHSQLRRPHRSRGRFAYRRYVRGAERVFTRRPERPEPPAFLTVLLDVSGSMARQRLFTHAKRCVAFLSAAAEIANTALRVIPFREETAPPLSSRQVGHEAVRQALAALHPAGRTQLAPALRAGLDGTVERSNCSGSSGRHIVALISDGELSERDAKRCQKIYRRAQHQHSALKKSSPLQRSSPLVLPLLLGEATRGRKNSPSSGKGVYEQVFGRYSVIEDAAELPQVARRWLRHAA